MRVFAIVLAGLCGGLPSAAEGLAGTAALSSEMRARIETVAQDEFERDAVAATVRLRTSLEIEPATDWRALIEVEAIADLLPKSRNGFGRINGRPAIPDEETLELNRLQASYAPGRSLLAVAGRQRISLDDERFLGSVDFRQNQQTFDAATAELRPQDGVLLATGVIWRVNRFLGNRSVDGVFEGDGFFLNASLPIPAGRLAAFHYDFDLDTGQGPGDPNALSNRTYGVRLEGRRYASGLGVIWQASYAVQDGRSAGRASYSADYAMADLAFETDAVAFGARFEALGAGDTGAFQTPLATAHRFQGGADVFVVTPQTGVRERSVRAVWRPGSLGAFRNVSARAALLDFEADDGSGRLGREIDLGVTATVRGLSLSLEMSAYEADAFASDTRKWWLSASTRF